MTISTASIAKLRERTGAGIIDVKFALEEADGDESRAIEILRKKGAAKAVKRAGKVAAEGRVASYIHGEGRVGVLLEMNCETDFVARSEKFAALVKDIAMHIAAANPSYVSREQVPATAVERERAVYREQLSGDKKSPEVLEKIIESKLAKFYEEQCLLDQPFIKDEERSVAQVLESAVGEIGEKIVVRRFARYELGEGIEKEHVDFLAEVQAQLEN